MQRAEELEKSNAVIVDYSFELFGGKKKESSMAVCWKKGRVQKQFFSYFSMQKIKCGHTEREKGKENLMREMWVMRTEMLNL